MLARPGLARPGPLARRVSAALVAVVVVNGNQAATVIKAGTGGFATSITAAEKG